MGRENHNRKDSFYVKKLENGKKTMGRRKDVLVFKRRITVLLLQMIGCLIVFSSSLLVGEGVFIQVEG